MTCIPPERGDAHYTSGVTFRPLSDAERRLLAEHAPAPDGGRALDVGCGLGELARHLAAAGYRVDAVDSAPAAVAHAAAQAEDEGVAERENDNPAQSGTGGAVTYRVFDIERDDLGGLAPAYDLITFRLSWAFLRDRTRVMSQLRERLRPGGTVCVITSLTDTVPRSGRHSALDEDEIALLCAGWGTADRHDADGLAVVVLRDPAPPEVTYAGRGQPSPHALTGAGAVVTDPDGRVLLGWSRRGVWELPGGKNDAGEGFLDAAVREFEEETGLRATKARVLALLMDSTHGIPRMTAAVRILTYTGEPVVREPRLIRRWEWHEPADLPALTQPLFTPSAHVIDTVWPGLLTGLPRVHRYPVA
ncbi:NUDIX domain-containing protein [Streptomyces sp. NPDC005925]|uniref:bifunctional class I SAM-dependent methyltransferase/NUDIX hydrolase n=1 Tax=Streptomyces sp. NPDC005925 TaxID=3157172 RepID=UPI0034044037